MNQKENKNPHQSSLLGIFNVCSESKITANKKISDQSQTNQKKLVKKCAAGTGIFAACCFGLLSILGVFGFTTALLYINNYGDYVLLPAYAAFGTVLVYALMQWKRNIYTYIASAITIGIMIYFSVFGILWFSIILGGVLLGGISIRIIDKKQKC